MVCACESIFAMRYGTARTPDSDTISDNHLRVTSGAIRQHEQAHAPKACMGKFFLAVSYDLLVAGLHGSCEEVTLVIAMGDTESRALVLMAIQESKYYECVPDFFCRDRHLELPVVTEGIASSLGLVVQSCTVGGRNTVDETIVRHETEKKKKHALYSHQVHPMHRKCKLNKLMFRDLDILWYTSIICPRSLMDGVVVVIVCITH